MMYGLDSLIEAVATGTEPKPPPVKISRGRMVTTLGPWSNGHEEQCGIVTHVYGTGIAGDLVNLHVFVDLAQPLIIEAVPWYPTRRDAEQAFSADPNKASMTGNTVCCYFPERT